MKTGNLILAAAVLALIAIIAVDVRIISRLESDFVELEKQRIVTSNKLATAKIVYENLNHVRDLVFKNMDFQDRKEPASQESIFFEFLTTCVNDLKLRLISVKPVRPKTENLITTYGYDIEIEGDFFKFGELCAKFENSRRIVSLEEFSVDLLRKSTLKKSSTSGIQVKMRVNTFRIKKSVEMPTVGGTAGTAAVR